MNCGMITEFKRSEVSGYGTEKKFSASGHILLTYNNTFNPFKKYFNFINVES
jgi:hypothetical protein